MGSASWDTDGQDKKKSQRFAVFRFRRGSPVAENVPAFPFTEVPDDLKSKANPIGRYVRKFINFLFLFVLVLALIGLVLAFGYQLIHNPQLIITWCTQVVESVLQIIRSLAQK